MVESNTNTGECACMRACVCARARVCVCACVHACVRCCEVVCVNMNVSYSMLISGVLIISCESVSHDY